MWIGAFTGATSKGSLIYSSGFGRQLGALGSDLALSSPKSLFMAHEWISALCLRPQAHAHVWLTAVAVFGPLWLHHKSLLEDAVQDMHLSEDETPTVPMHASHASRLTHSYTSQSSDPTHDSRCDQLPIIDHRSSPIR